MLLGLGVKVRGRLPVTAQRPALSQTLRQVLAAWTLLAVSAPLANAQKDEARLVDRRISLTAGPFWFGLRGSGVARFAGVYLEGSERDRWVAGQIGVSIANIREPAVALPDRGHTVIAFVDWGILLRRPHGRFHPYAGFGIGPMFYLARGGKRGDDGYPRSYGFGLNTTYGVTADLTDRIGLQASSRRHRWLEDYFSADHAATQLELGLSIRTGSHRMPRQK